MPRIILLFVLTSFMFMGSYAHNTHRILEFSNDKISAWQTIIYPSKKQILKMHYHQHDRVLIALTGGTLKVVNDKQKSHLLRLKKNHVYFLPKDKQDEKHSDENTTHHPIKVIVIDLHGIN